MDKEWSFIRKLIWLKATALAGESFIWKTVTGTAHSGSSPMKLTNAVAKPVQSLKQFGKCVQNGTPTLANPSTIVINRGDIGWARSFPIGYIPLEYVTDNADAYIATDWHLMYDSFVFADVEFGSSACNVFGCFTSSGASDNFTLYRSAEGSTSYVRYNGSLYRNTIISAERHYLEMAQWGFGLDYEETETFDSAEFECSAPFYIGWLANSSSPKFSGKIYSISVTGAFRDVPDPDGAEGDTIREHRDFDFYPAKRASDGKIGFMDTINGDFYYSSVSAQFGEGPVSNDWGWGDPYMDSYFSQISMNRKQVNVPKLLAAGSIKDEAEVISGKKTARCMLKYLDGSETYGNSTAYGSAVFITSAATSWKANKDCTPVCTHFVGTPMVLSGSAEDGTCFFNQSGHFYFRTSMSANDFRDMVEEKYYAGEPIMIVVAASKETTQQFIGQAFETVDGENNLISYSQATGTEFEVTYAATE